MEQLIIHLVRWQNGFITKEEMYDQWFLIIADALIEKESSSNQIVN
jgi:hypothetical protein